MDDLDGDDTDSSTSSPAAPARLRARIMASGFEYQMLGERDKLGLQFEENNTRKESNDCLKTCLVLLGLVGLALLVALVFVVARHTEHGTALKVCVTPECVGTSAAILSRMDKDVPPCQDMYRLACGKWIEEAKPPPGEPAWSMFTVLEQGNDAKLRLIAEKTGSLFKGQNSTSVKKWKTWYHSCMDTDSIEIQGRDKMKQLMSQLGYWTVSPSPHGSPSWNRRDWSIQESLVNTHRLLTSSLFKFGVIKDPTIDENKNVIEFSQSGLTLEYVSGYDSKTSRLKDGFLAYASKVGILLGGKESDVRAKMEDVFEFERQLSKIFVPSEEMSHRSIYNKYNLSQFEELLGNWVNVKDYLQDMFYGRQFEYSTQVIVKTPAYFSKLGQVVNSADKETVANYMMWHLLHSMIDYLPEDFRRASLELSKVQSGTTLLPDRWRFCVDKARGAVGFAGAALYVENYFSSASKNKVTEALENIRAEFISLLDNVKWLDQVTRSKLKDKAQDMSLRVGYPDWILNRALLDKHYEKLEVEESEFFFNMLSHLAFALNETLNKYDKEPDGNVWPIAPDIVNAFYSWNENHITVTAGILQPPFYSPDYNEALLYGTIGTILGHELTHGFDNNGRLFNKNGQLEQQWTPAAEKGFKAATACLVDQYSSFSWLGHQLNGDMTLGENIADNGGLKLAYRAFRSAGQASETSLPGLNFTVSQLFYLGFSQMWCDVMTPENVLLMIETNVHSLHRFRVKGTLSNSAEFASAFGCAVGSPLNPASKCEVW
ncbi:hypothetical protein RRG08_017128 [Elysia crispata]|uniref:Endothelin-converting enzyme 1 n=1 Tax=Elysia crispata TaxID=231223 RepID=A0AAE1DX79_9GAST|nr:hypothetical protein RRG08_017128 [Elysia crispata]